MRSDDDLAAWERGSLPKDELLRRHPEVAGLIRVHERFSAVASDPVPDPGTGFEDLRERLTERNSISGRSPVSRFRRVLVAVAAVLLFGATAFAAVPEVRDGLSDLFGGHGAAVSPDPGGTGAPSEGVVVTDPGVADGDDQGSSGGESDEHETDGDDGGSQADQGEDADGDDQGVDESPGDGAGGADDPSEDDGGDRSTDGSGDGSGGDEGDAIGSGDGSGGAVDEQ